MADPQNSSIGGNIGQGTSSGGTGTSSFGSFSVPQEVQEQFPDLVPQILASPSMDDEERKYWFSVLPIMTEDQIKELRDILKTEQDRISLLEKGEATTNIDIQQVEEERHRKYEEQKNMEQESRENDDQEAEDLLNALEEIG